MLLVVFVVSTVCSTCAKQKLSQPVEANDDDDDDNDNVVNNNTDRCMVIIRGTSWSPFACE